LIKQRSSIPEQENTDQARAASIVPDVADQTYSLRLYVTGATQHSMLAVNHIKEICERYLAGRYSIEIIDIYQQPNLTEERQIIATPTLVKLAPLPVRYLVGDMSNTRAVLEGLGITEVV
jgi:circadian clock protein KaiB